MPVQQINPITPIHRLDQRALMHLVRTYWVATDGPAELLPADAMVAFAMVLEHASIVAEMQSDEYAHPNPICSCGASWEEHPFGDGIEECAGDFPVAKPVAYKSPTVVEIEAKIAELRTELRKQAGAGDTLGCGEIHRQANVLRETLAILAGEI